MRVYLCVGVCLEAQVPEGHWILWDGVSRQLGAAQCGC